MANTYLTRTVSASSATKATLSLWVKRSSLGEQCLYAIKSGSDEVRIAFTSSNQFQFYKHNGSSFNYRIVTDRVFRDTNAWYHIVCVFNSTESTASDRTKIYVNGVQETSLNNVTNPSSNDNCFWFQSATGYIGVEENGSSNDFDGIISHLHMVEGTAYPASTFGSVDATTGEWKINTSPTLTMGTNGFTILKDGNTVTDQSTNSNAWAVAGGTLTKTEDNPSNVFATMNPLIYAPNANTYTNGNTKVEGTDANWRQSGGTLGMTSGKFYWEGKYINSNDHNGTIGIKESVFANQGNDNKGGTTNGYNGLCYTNDGVSLINNTSSGGAESYGSKFGYTGSSWIMSVALDLDNNKLYFAQNGVWQNSGVPTSGSTGTGALSVASASGGDGVWLPFNSTHKSAWEMNFGNGYFGTTAVSSAGTNASGIGIFEYDVPAGYTALSTKGLNL